MKISIFAISAMGLSLVAPSGFITAKASAAPAGSMAVAYQEAPWDQPPGEYRDVQRQGFHDGIEGARKDFDNHRPPNPENREEFRHPHVPGDARHDYREAFRRGYDVGMHHMMDERDHHHD